MKSKKNYLILLATTIFVVLTFEACSHKKLKLKSSLNIGEAPWGIEFNAIPPHIDKYPHELNAFTASRTDSLIALASELGVKWVRLSVNWSNIVDTAGNYHWSIIDRIVGGLVKNKINIALCLNGGHRLYTKSHAPSTPEAIDYWKTFAKTIIQRYKGKITHWELWNEPNTVWFWKPAPNAAGYVALMKEFHKLVKKSDSTAKVIGGSIARLDLVFADSILKMGIGQYIDAFSFHPYNEFPEAIVNPVKVSVKTPVWYTETDHSADNLRAMLDSVNPAISIWQGECGYPSQDNGSGWMGNGPWSPAIQAKWLLRRMLTDISYNAGMIGYFCLSEYNSAGNIDEGKGVLNSKGLLTLKKLSKKPAFFAYQNLISLINGKINARFSDAYAVKIEDYGSFYNIGPKNILFEEIENENNRFLAYWVKWRMQDVVIPAKINVEISNPFTNPVLVNLLTGRITPVKTHNIQNTQQLMQLPLADYPFIITEKSTVTEPK